MKLPKNGISSIIGMSNSKIPTLSLYKNNKLIGQFNSNIFNIVKIPIKNTHQYINYSISLQH